MVRWALSLLLMAALLSRPAIAVEPRPITDADQVLAIYTEDWGLGAGDPTQLIFCLWDDGRLVWSDDPLHGGAPFKTATVPADTLSKTLQRFDELGVFEMPQRNRAHWGPDSSFTQIVMRGKKKQTELSSWHELYEAGGKAIAFSKGVRALQAGEALLPALAHEPAEYLHFRMTWLEVRLAAANLIPKAGTPVTGTATMKAGKLFWQPAAEE